ncbi:MAG: hypothetical protein U0800_16420 [Isosphaeraceae bacterium]
MVLSLVGAGWYSARSNPAWRALLAWFVIPPLLLFAYSQFGHPLFGPARYTLFVAPAYLLMVAVGMSSMPRLFAIVLAIAGAVLSASLLWQSVYKGDLKADWRRAAIELSRIDPNSGLVVVATKAARNVEVETARYYLPAGWEAVPQFDDNGVPWDELLDPADSRPIVFAAGARDGDHNWRAFAAGDDTIELDGLDLIVLRSRILGQPGPDRAPDR